MPPSSRQALSFQQKDALRNFKQQHPEATQQICQAWFYEQFNKKITQSTISEILAYKKPRRVRNPNRQRESSSKYPELDPVLYERAITLQKNGSRLTFPFLQQLAYDTWPLVYGDRELPNISVGMMQRFATRNNLEIPSSRPSLASYPNDNRKQQQQIQHGIVTDIPQSYYIASTPTTTEPLCSQPPQPHVYTSPVTPGYDTNAELPPPIMIKDQSLVAGSTGSYQYYIANHNTPLHSEPKQIQSYTTQQKRLFPLETSTTAITSSIPSVSRSPLISHSNYSSLPQINTQQQVTQKQLPVQPIPFQMNREISSFNSQLVQPFQNSLNKSVMTTGSNSSSVLHSDSNNLNIYNSGYYQQPNRANALYYYPVNSSNNSTLLKSETQPVIVNTEASIIQWGNQV